MAGKILPGSVVYPGLLALALIVFGWQLSPVEDLPESISEPVVSKQAPISVFPDFAAVVEVDERKQQFFQFLKDYIAAANAEVLETRQQLKRYDEIAATGSRFSPTERAWILALADEYDVDTGELFEREITTELMRRVE